MAAHLAVDANTLDQLDELETLSLRLFGVRYLPQALSFHALIHIKLCVMLFQRSFLDSMRWFILADDSVAP